MAISQLDLPLTHRYRMDSKDPRIAALIDYLSGKGWVLSRDITAEKSWSDRLIRALAEASEGRIMSGQLGYKITREASRDEVDRATAFLESQAGAMRERARQTWRVFHRG